MSEKSIPACTSWFFF